MCDIRQERGISQEEISEQLNVKQATYSKLERTIVDHFTDDRAACHYPPTVDQFDNWEYAKNIYDVVCGAFPSVPWILPEIHRSQVEAWHERNARYQIEELAKIKGKAPPDTSARRESFGDIANFRWNLSQLLLILKEATPIGSHDIDAIKARLACTWTYRQNRIRNYLVRSRISRADATKSSPCLINLHEQVA